MIDSCYLGDVRDVLRAIAAAGIRPRTCVTSPPYWGLRDYGVAGQLGLEPTIDAYVANMVEVFRLVRDVLADDGTLWLNLGDSYAGGGNYRGNSLLSEKQASNGGAHGQVGAIPIPDGLKPKDLAGVPWRVAFALQADGWWLRQDIIWHKPNPMPESIRDRCTKAHEYLFLLSKRERYFYDADAIQEASVTNDPRRPYGSPGANALDQRGEQGRGQLRTKKPDGWATHAGGPGSFHRDGREKGAPAMIDATTRNRRSVWTIATEAYPDAHFATFPTALVEPCILAGSEVGDVVLDPFMGSGTVAQVAQALGRHWVGCELNPEYHAMQAQRTRSRGLPLTAA